MFCKVWEEDIGGGVCLSTEEMLPEIKRVNNSNPTTPVVIGSADVKALYASLDIDFIIDKVCEVFEGSGLSVGNLNFKN